MANDEGLKKSIFNEVMLRLGGRRYDASTKEWQYQGVDEIIRESQKAYDWIKSDG